MKILLVYDHFLPAWKAGGPIRSIEQMIKQLSTEFNFFVLCSAYDHGEDKVLENIIIDKWTDWQGNGKVYYNSIHKPGLSFYKKVYDQIMPDILFINGLYSLFYNIKPLIAAQTFIKKNKQTKIFLSPRGMLHPGALTQKRNKKKIFFLAFKLLSIHKNIVWHATDEKEVHFIRAKFKKAYISIAGNFPKLSVPIPSPLKEKGKLILGTLALIGPMKNHLEILNALKSINCNVVWHIFGPVKDLNYWYQCNKIINELPSNIHVVYHGAIPPEQVSESLKKIQVFILPSKSENFGHAIFEAMSVGKPVITTNTTPFTDLNQKKVGYTLPVDDLQAQLIKSIHDFADMDQEEFSFYQNNAILYSNSFVNIEKIKDQYRTMFSAS